MREHECGTCEFQDTMISIGAAGEGEDILNLKKGTYYVGVIPGNGAGSQETVVFAHEDAEVFENPADFLGDAAPDGDYLHIFPVAGGDLDEEHGIVFDNGQISIEVDELKDVEIYVNWNSAGQVDIFSIVCHDTGYFSE